MITMSKACKFKLEDEVVVRGRVAYIYGQGGSDDENVVKDAQYGSRPIEVCFGKDDQSEWFSEDQVVTAFNTFTDGLKEGFELAVRLTTGDLSDVETRRKVFGVSDLHNCLNLPIEELRDRLYQYDRHYNSIRPGCVIKQDEFNKLFLVISDAGSHEYPYDVIDLDTKTIDRITGDPKHFTVTGTFIDLDSMLSDISHRVEEERAK